MSSVRGGFVVLLGAACIVVIASLEWIGATPSPNAGAAEQAEELPRGVASGSGDPLPEDAQVVEATAPVMEVEPDGEDRDDTRGSLPEIADAPPANATRGKQTSPRSLAERQMFLQVVYTPMASQLGGPEDVADIRNRLTDKLRPDLRNDEMEAATKALECAVVAEQRYRIARADAIAAYIMTAEDLAVPRPHDGREGCNGLISHGIEPEWAGYWGNAQSLRVSYFLAYEDYPDLKAAHAERAQARKTLKPYSR